jgi:hypothetical protein
MIEDLDDGFVTLGMNIPVPGRSCSRGSPTSTTGSSPWG